MKFSELKQAMDWRRRVGFNGGGYVRAKFANGKRVLPKKKPEEEAEKVNKARKEKTFEKAKGALENPKEVKEMIDKPKRGLVDEPGSYGGEGSGGKPGQGKGVPRPLKSLAGKCIYTITEFAKLNNQPFTEQTLRSGIATKNKNIINGLKAAGIEILPKTKAGQATRLKMINSTKSMGKLVDYAMNLPKPPKSLSQPFYNEIPKAFNQLVKEGNPFSQADVAKRVLSNLKDSPYKPSQKAFEEVVGKNLTKAQKKKLTPGKITRALTETVPKRTVFEQVLEGNTNVKQLAKESGLSQKEVQKTARNIVLGIYQAKKNIGLKQDIPDVVLKDYGLDDYKKALDAIRDEPTLNVEYRRGIKDALFEAYGNPNSKTYSKKKYERSLKRLDAFLDIRDAINEAFPDGRFNLQLDHHLSEQAIRNLDNITPDQLVRVSPLTEEINLGLKKTFDERYQTILKNLKGEGGRRGTLDLDRKNLIKQKARIELLAKDLDIPLGKVSLTGKPVKFGTQEITKKNFAKEITEGLK